MRFLGERDVYAVRLLLSS